LRSALPVRRWKGNKLPNLKTWVKVVFALYIVVTVPVLALLFLLLVTGLPYIAPVVWDSLLVQAQGFSFALDSGELLGMAASGAQASILMLQVLGTSYLLILRRSDAHRGALEEDRLCAPARRPTGILIIAECSLAANLVFFVTGRNSHTRRRV